MTAIPTTTPPHGQPDISGLTLRTPKWLRSGENQGVPEMGCDPSRSETHEGKHNPSGSHHISSSALSALSISLPLLAASSGVKATS